MHEQTRNIYRRIGIGALSLSALYGGIRFADDIRTRLRPKPESDRYELIITYSPHGEDPNPNPAIPYTLSILRRRDLLVLWNAYPSDDGYGKPTLRHSPIQDREFTTLLNGELDVQFYGSPPVCKK